MRRLALLLALGPCACPRSDPARSEPGDPPATERPARAGRTWSFDGDAVGAIPPGVRTGETGSVGKPADWAVVDDGAAPSPPRAFGIVRSDNPKAAVFQVALLDEPTLADLQAEVQLSAAAGVHDQGGGLVWRARGFDDYYVARWNPLEANLRVYVVEQGKRRQLAELATGTPAAGWHRLSVTVEADHFEVALDDGPTLTGDDATLGGAGQIGLWTKSDAATLFDDLSATEL